MLKRKLCEAVITWELECKGPLLIRDERWHDHLGKQDQGFPSTMFMSRLTLDGIKQQAKLCANNPPNNLRFYVPGTSLRGPFRSQAELIIRSLLSTEDETGAGIEAGTTACDPFRQEEGMWQSCSKRLEKETGAADKYRAACPVCRLFGCAGLASRISFTDADIQEDCISVYRDMIGIDRFTGGVAKDAKGHGANMRFHVLENTRFTSTVRLTNFELWQLGLLAYVFRDFSEGTVAIGFGKSKGFGLVTGKVRRIVFAQLPGKAETAKKATADPEAVHLGHLGSLMGEKERAEYGVVREDPLTDLDPYLMDDPQGLSFYQHYALEDEQGLALLWQQAAAAFNRRMEELQQRQPLQQAETEAPA